MKNQPKILALNRRAKSEYAILNAFEAGLELKGFEVKAIKAGRADLTSSYCVFHQGELFVIGLKIHPYQAKNLPSDFNLQRSIKLLLHKKELKGIQDKTKSQKLTIIPLKLYNKAGLVKLEIALAKGLKKYQKKEKLKKRDIEIETARTLKSLK